MDLSSNHPRVMLVAQPFSVQLHITPLPQNHPIALGDRVSLGRLALKPSRQSLQSYSQSIDPFILAATNHDDDFFVEEPKKKRFDLTMSPRGQSVLYMALAMALHFGGYEFARSATLALFTSSTTGFSTPAAFPFAMAMVTPMSFVFLLAYAQDLQDNGPKLALRHSTLVSILILTSTGVILKLLELHPVVLFGNVLLSQLVVGLAFLFQNSYAHLLYSQQWSFIGSVMTPEEGCQMVCFYCRS